MDGQMDIFSFLNQEEQERDQKAFLSVGDKIGRNVLGETRIATITEVCGSPHYIFYRTDRGCCYNYSDSLKSIDTLLKEAEEERKKYKTIIPHDLQERITVEYEPRKCDGVILWAQIGIFENMLFWKEDVTYQFLELYKTEKQLLKEYEKRKSKILSGKFKFLEQEKEMRRLYWSKKGFYADAEYVEHNG